MTSIGLRVSSDTAPFGLETAATVNSHSGVAGISRPLGAPLGQLTDNPPASFHSVEVALGSWGYVGDHHPRN